jgi:hypothetical protein
MSWYEILLFCHIACAITWLGAGLLSQVQSTRAARSTDRNAILHLLKDSGGLALLIFIPASMGTLIFGILLVIVGGWGFESLWVVLALAGFLASFVVGNFVLKPSAAKIAETVKRDGNSAEVMSVARRLILAGRIELVILYSTVANMVLKPSLHDVSKLTALGAALAVGIAMILFFSRPKTTTPETFAHAS